MASWLQCMRFRQEEASTLGECGTFSLLHSSYPYEQYGVLYTLHNSNHTYHTELLTEYPMYICIHIKFGLESTNSDFDQMWDFTSFISRCWPLSDLKCNQLPLVIGGNSILLRQRSACWLFSPALWIISSAAILSRRSPYNHIRNIPLYFISGETRTIMRTTRSKVANLASQTISHQLFGL